MSQHFDVVGYDEDGYGIAAEEYWEDDVSGSIMGAPARRVMPLAHAVRRPPPRIVRLPAKPQWRAQLAPGVIQPDEGQVPLPLSPLTAGGVFAAGGTSITFQGQLQKPFRAERLLTSVVRTGATATGRLLAQLWIGTDLQQADIFGFDIELFGSPTAFGTRLTCKAAQPGVLIRLVVTPTAFPTGTDTILATCSFAGRVVH
jgi:hypothetical protein